MMQLTGKLATDNVCKLAVNICSVDESQSIYIFYPIGTPFKGCWQGYECKRTNFSPLCDIIVVNLCNESNYYFYLYRQFWLGVCSPYYWCHCIIEHSFWSAIQVRNFKGLFNLALTNPQDFSIKIKEPFSYCKSYLSMVL